MENSESIERPLFDLAPEVESEEATESDIEARSRQFGKYIVYVDESGDHGLTKVDRQFPVFTLAFCIFS